MVSLRLSCLILLLAVGCRALEGVDTILPNGTRRIVEAEDVAVDVTDVNARALPEDGAELKNLLNWAISMSYTFMCIPLLAPRLWISVSCDSV